MTKFESYSNLTTIMEYLEFQRGGGWEILLCSAFEIRIHTCIKYVRLCIKFENIIFLLNFYAIITSQVSIYQQADKNCLEFQNCIRQL